MQAPGYRLPNAAHVGRVRLAVSELARSVAFYRDVIGLRVLAQDGELALLGVAGNVLLELEALPGVQPIGRRTRLGLYHTAFLLPSRSALGGFVNHLREAGVAFGAGDHLYSEALYLVDPDGLSVEVYADRPRSTWTAEGQELVSATNAVDFASLSAAATGTWAGAPEGTTVGHIHLYVGDLQEAARFYHEALGLTIMTWRYPGALFTSAGGYHHHVGLNVWAAGSPVASETDARLLYWELRLPDAEKAAKSLRAGGFEVSVDNDGSFSCTDSWGIRVKLIEES